MRVWQGCFSFKPTIFKCVKVRHMKQRGPLLRCWDVLYCALYCVCKVLWWCSPEGVSKWGPALTSVDWIMLSIIPCGRLRTWWREITAEDSDREKVSIAARATTLFHTSLGIIKQFPDLNFMLLACLDYTESLPQGKQWPSKREKWSIFDFTSFITLQVCSEKLSEALVFAGYILKQL